MTEQRLRKAERLKSRKAIGELFNSGKSLKEYPLRIVWRQTAGQSPYPVQAAFSVPRKLVKRAVKRNLIKRRMREAYRLYKSSLYEVVGNSRGQLHLMLIYTSTEVLSFDIISAAMSKALVRLGENM